MKAAVILFLFLSLQVSAALLSPRTYNKLNDIQQTINETTKPEGLLDIESDLIELENDLQGNSLGLALTWQTHAQLQVKLEQYNKAEALLKKAVSLTGLDNKTHLQLKLFLAQILLAQEKYLDITVLLESTISNKGYQISAPVYALLAASYYYLNQYSQGLPHIIQAIKLAKNPKEAWLQMAFSGHYHQKDYRQALVYSNLLVLNFPHKKDYWMQKSGIHQMLEDYTDAAIGKDLANKKGFIEKESEYINLGQLLAGQGDPFKVATLLEHALFVKDIPKSEKSLRLLQQAWMQSKEIEKGRSVLSQLFAQFRNSKEGLRLIRLLVDAQKWQQGSLVANELYKLEITDKQIGEVLLLDGICQYRLGSSRKALVSLSKAAAIKSSSSQAKGWMSYIKQLEGS
ncbi:MAG: hypothetical protein V7785_06655 [Bermanella sp.]